MADESPDIPSDGAARVPAHPYRVDSAGRDPDDASLAFCLILYGIFDKNRR
jgi:hypothetical protein